METEKLQQGLEKVYKHIRDLSNQYFDYEDELAILSKAIDFMKLSEGVEGLPEKVKIIEEDHSCGYIEGSDKIDACSVCMEIGKNEAIDLCRSLWARKVSIDNLVKIICSFHNGNACDNKPEWEWKLAEALQKELGGK